MALGGGEGSKGGGGGGGEGNKGCISDFAVADEERGGLLEEESGCSTSGRRGPLLPELHGILMPCPGAASSTGDGVARRFPPIKIDFSRKGKGTSAEGTPGFSKNSLRKTTAGGLVRGAAEGTSGFSNNSVGKTAAGGLGRGCASTSAAEGTSGCFSKNSVQKSTAAGLGSCVGCFKGFRILPLGFKNSSQEEISLKIKAHGGQVASLSDYDTCTHICLGNELNKTLIGEDWINLPHDGEPETAERNQVVTSRQMIAELNLDSRVRRELFPLVAIDEERIRRRHHQLFHCMNDQSDLITFAAFAQKMRSSLIVSGECPGTNRKDFPFHISTLLELKLLCKEAYLLLKALKTAEYTLGGNFSSENFVVVDRVTGRDQLFGQLQKDSLQLTTSAKEIHDEKSFKRMTIGLFPRNVLPPHDLVTWLSLVGRKDMEWLLLNSWTLLEEQDARERFLFLGGKLQELYDNVRTREVYDRIVQKLDKRGYGKWQEKLACGNNYLKNTLNRIDHNSKLPQFYPKHAGGLLLLLRNCRHHYAKAVADKFLMIVADHFPNLLMDFQEVMYFEGFHD